MEISKIIISVDTDYRGNLFEEVANCLRTNTQGYTAALMKTTALTYGINRDTRPDDHKGEVK